MKKQRRRTRRQRARRAAALALKGGIPISDVYENGSLPKVVRVFRGGRMK